MIQSILANKSLYNLPTVRTNLQSPDEKSENELRYGYKKHIHTTFTIL